MHLLLSLFVALIGLLELLAPNLWWELTESWKSNSSSEPSDFYLKITRISGVFFTVVGIGGFIVLLVLVP